MWGGQRDEHCLAQIQSENFLGGQNSVICRWNAEFIPWWIQIRTSQHEAGHEQWIPLGRRRFWLFI